MGSWNVTINGNDTALDLKKDYQAAFLYNDVDTALQKIDNYILSKFDETDEEEWCNYYYSLADFMWKHGILTDKVRDCAVSMIDSGFGLDIWAEAGNKTLEKRKKVLAEFRNKLLSPQPPKKKIKINLYLSTIFETGDIVAIQLKTSDKLYMDYSHFSEKFFRECDGKYVVMRKVKDHVSYASKIEPSVKDHWAIFQLYSKVFDNIPTAEELKHIPWANTAETERSLFSKKYIRTNPFNGLFVCESTMFYFKKRKYAVIGKDISHMPYNLKTEENHIPSIYLGFNHQNGNADTDILDSICSKSSLKSMITSLFSSL